MREQLTLEDWVNAPCASAICAKSLCLVRGIAQEARNLRERMTPHETPGREEPAAPVFSH